MKKRPIKFSVVTTLLISALASSCGNDATPRPVGYMRIELPDTQYAPLKMVSESECPYSFEINTESHWENSNDGECWGNVVYPSIDAQVQFTYKSIDGNLEELLNEAHSLAYKHTVRADGIREKMIDNRETDVHGLMYRMRGEAATTTQFFLTDSTDHFLRGVVYFYASPNADSLRPVDNFMANEVEHMISTTRWKNK